MEMINCPGCNMKVEKAFGGTLLEPAEGTPIPMAFIHHCQPERNQCEECRGVIHKRPSRYYGGAYDQEVGHLSTCSMNGVHWDGNNPVYLSERAP